MSSDRHRIIIELGVSCPCDKPYDCAVRPLVPMRRKFKAQYAKLNIEPPIAIAPIKAAPPM